MNKNAGQTKIILFFLSLMMFFIFITGCTDNCIISENKNISSSIKDISRKSENYGLMNHYNISIAIANNGNDFAKNPKIETYYCNKFDLGHHCENRTFQFVYLPPKTTVQRYFEYDMDALRDVTLGDHTLKYYAVSCFPRNDTQWKIS